MDLRVTVLPEGVHETTFLRLPHPRTGRPSLYLPYAPSTSGAVLGEAGLPTPIPSPSSATASTPSDGLLEVQCVQPPVDARRSWFVDQSVVADGRMNILTPCDPLFLLLPMLQAVQSTNIRSLPYQDLFETAAEAHTFSSGGDDSELVSAGDDALRFGEMACVRALVQRICDVERISDELMTYRLSLDKAIALLKAKVERLAEQKAFDGRFTLLRRALARQGVGDGHGIDEDVARQARTKTALEIIGNYLPAHVDDLLHAEYSFEELQAYVAQQAPAIAVVDGDEWVDPDPRKMGTSKPKGGGAALAKRQASKKNVNRNTERLKKVDVRNNSKLTGFFKKA